MIKVPSFIGCLRSREAYMKNNTLVRSLKIAFKTCPLDCVLMLIVQLLIAFLPIGGLYILKCLINSMTTESANVIFIYILAYVVLIWLQKAVQDWHDHYFLMYFSLLKFEKKIKKIFFRICLSMRLDDYNDAGFVNHSLRAKNASVNILRLYQAVVELVCTFVSVLAMGVVISAINSNLFLVFIIMSATEIIDNIFILYQNKKFLYENTQLEKEENEISELLFSAKTLKEIILLRSTQFILGKWADVAAKIIKNERNKNTKIFIFSLFMKSVYCAGTLLAYLLVFRSYMNGEIGIGEFSVSISAFVMMRGIFSSLFAEVSNVSQFAVMVNPFFDYVDNVMKRSGKEHNENDSSTIGVAAGYICLNNVTYKYHNAENNSLDHIDLMIEEGKKYVIVGENGSGKTTLMKVIMGLFEPTEGEISYENINLTDWHEKQLHEAFSDVSQDYNMYAVSVKDNILFGKEENGIDVDQALQEMDLQELQNKKDCAIGKEFSGIELSGGQKQKIAILRAENKGGKVFCLDEPTSAIDPLQEKKIFERIYSVAEGKTTIIVSHRLALCKLADYIIVMDQGKVAEMGTHDELMRKSGIYEAMYNKQVQLYHFS